eukprot:TRINITY_DN17324_c3_g1_i1.p1 TRINITY_DN17324_c3_g1~~TRINITY_DN17324_c3_g1_i1.p1  ORF type:complete len:112 (+),score=24.97 TRINITY_DN17324_c3_g1_i1:153-488(+)
MRNGGDALECHDSACYLKVNSLTESETQRTAPTTGATPTSSARKFYVGVLGVLVATLLLVQFSFTATLPRAIMTSSVQIPEQSTTFLKGVAAAEEDKEEEEEAEDQQQRQH